MVRGKYFLFSVLSAAGASAPAFMRGGAPRSEFEINRLPVAIAPLFLVTGEARCLGEYAA